VATRPSIAVVWSCVPKKLESTYRCISLGGVSRADPELVPAVSTCTLNNREFLAIIECRPSCFVAHCRTRLLALPTLPHYRSRVYVQVLPFNFQKAHRSRYRLHGRHFRLGPSLSPFYKKRNMILHVCNICRNIGGYKHLVNDLSFEMVDWKEDPMIEK